MKNFFPRVALTLVIALITAATRAQDPATIGSIQYNSDLGAYEINCTDNLNDLAVYVNGFGTYSNGDPETTHHNCAGMKFKMTADIAYPHTTAWNDASSTENNYEAIGWYDGHTRGFCGEFDGQGHTVSGIRIYHPGAETADDYQGLFGVATTDSQTPGSKILNLTLSDAIITGQKYVGGIAGTNTSSSWPSIQNCHVTSTVAIHAVQTKAYYHGGITGLNKGGIQDCTCAATLTLTDSIHNGFFGGIAGTNGLKGSIGHTLVIGATIPSLCNNISTCTPAYGAIAGHNIDYQIGTGIPPTLTLPPDPAELASNYYVACTVGGIANATGVGRFHAEYIYNYPESVLGDQTERDGAVPGYFLNFDEGITTNVMPITIPEHKDLDANGNLMTVGAITYHVTSAGRTVTLSTTEPLGYDFFYLVNGTPISGNTFTMPATDVTISTLPVDWTITNSGNSADDAYMIYTKEQLDLLAQRVNDGTSNYSGKFFKLGADIAYDHETEWNDATSTENNYESIGRPPYYFKGDFDGQGHTISGIRIYHPGTNSIDMDQGLFGQTEYNAKIHDLTLADARITGFTNCGGIVGHNYNIIDNCHVAANVAIHSIIESESHPTYYHGGIAGDNSGWIRNCTSAVTLSVTNASYSHYFGAIAGNNSKSLRDNLAIGAIIPAVGYNFHGAITGKNDHSLQRNYYVACTVAGVANATGVGCDSQDITDNDGAVPGNEFTLAGYGDSETSGWAFIASPLIADTDPSSAAVENLLSTPEFDLYRLNPDNAQWENWKQSGDHYHFSLENGRGYLYATHEQETVKFLGTATAFNQSNTKVVALGRGFNLVGNPFPRTAYIDKPYYALNQDGSALVTTPVAGSTAIKPCQSVVVQAINNDETATFSTTVPQQQNANNSQGYLQIALSQPTTNVRGTSAQTLDNAIVSFDGGSQLGKFYFGNQHANIYIPQDGEDYAIAFSEKHDEIPVNFEAHENGTYIITVSPENVEMAYLHLIDNLTGVDVDLLAQPSYTFEGRVSDYASRFKLVFNAKKSLEEIGDEGFAFIHDGKLIITGEGIVQVIDMLGRILLTQQDERPCVSTAEMAPGVYVIRLIQGDKMKNQKIVIN